MKRFIHARVSKAKGRVHIGQPLDVEGSSSYTAGSFITDSPTPSSSAALEPHQTTPLLPSSSVTDMTIQTSQPVADRVAPGRVTKRLPAKPSFKGSVPADVKPWVRDAKSWEPPAVRGSVSAGPGRVLLTAGQISLSICIGAKVEDVFVSPLIRFKSIKVSAGSFHRQTQADPASQAFIALHHYPDKGPGSLMCALRGAKALKEATLTLQPDVRRQASEGPRVSSEARNGG